MPFTTLAGLTPVSFWSRPMKGEGEAVVVDAELVENGGVEVADGHFVLDDVVGVVVGLAVGDSAFDSSAGHPGGEAFGMVVTAVLVTFEFALAIGGSSEFSGEDNEGFIEHAALLEIFDEAGAGLVDIVGLTPDFLGQSNVVIPTAVEELDKADAAFGHASGEKAVAGERTGFS